MEKQDVRRLSPDEKHQLRKQIIRAHERGSNRREISKLLGVGYNTVCETVKRFEALGTKSLRPQKSGRKSGEGRSLNPQQERELQQMICDKRPEQLKLEFALWNRTAVQLLIEREYKMKLSIRAVGNYLGRWGFTPQKPVKRAYEQRPEAVKEWLEKQYPAIALRAKEEEGEIHWGDETAVVNTDVRGRSYSPQGQTPVVFTVGGTRQKLSMISTVTNQGKTRWMIVDEAFDAAKLIEFLEGLIKDTQRKVFLILDNLRVHHSKPVKSWVQERVDKIELFYLPSYSPELNPDERLNADLKHAIGSKVPVRTKPKLRAAAEDHMTYLQRNPERVKAYFQDQPVNYAA